MRAGWHAPLQIRASGQKPIVTKEGAKRPDAECPKIRAKAATGKTDKPRGVVRFNEPTHIL